MAVSVSPPTGTGPRKAVELVASHHPRPEEMEAYERVLTDAMAGDETLFARQDYVEEAWRIVDPVLKANTPVHLYEPQTWGPTEAPQQAIANVTPPAGWQAPLPDEADDLHTIPQPA